MKAYACPCCGFLTLNEPPPGTYEICPVCYWEDDPVQFEDPAFAGGANRVSLTQARQNFLDLGAVSSEFVRNVRPPRNEEKPSA